MVEQRTHKPRAGGSIPSTATKFITRNLVAPETFPEHIHEYRYIPVSAIADSYHLFLTASKYNKTYSSIVRLKNISKRFRLLHQFEEGGLF